jgi:outer membrane protein
MKSLLIAGPTVVLAGMLLLSIPGVLPGQSEPSTAVTRVGYVSAQRLVSESSAGKSESARLQAAQQQRANDLKVKQSAWQTTRQQIVQGSGDAAALAKLQQIEQQQRMDFEQAAVQANNELQTMQRQVQVDLSNKARPIIADLAKARGFTIVLNSDASIAWADPSLDLTSAAVERLNALP